MEQDDNHSIQIQLLSMYYTILSNMRNVLAIQVLAIASIQETRCARTFEIKIPLSFGSRGLPLVDLVPPLILIPSLAEADFLTVTTF